MKNNKHIQAMSWFYAWLLLMAAWMLYANHTGWGLFARNNVKTWTAQGAGFHK